MMMLLFTEIYCLRPSLVYVVINNYTILDDNLFPEVLLIVCLKKLVCISAHGLVLIKFVLRKVMLLMDLNCYSYLGPKYTIDLITELNKKYLESDFIVTSYHGNMSVVPMSQRGYREEHLQEYMVKVKDTEYSSWKLRTIHIEHPLHK